MCKCCINYRQKYIFKQRNNTDFYGQDGVECKCHAISTIRLILCLTILKKLLFAIISKFWGQKV